MRTFVMGDIHGAHKALVQCLERSGFDKRSDRLITIGDVCDGWPHVRECVDELLTIDNRIDLIGNHDEWFLRWIKTGIHPDPQGGWKQGGQGTVMSYAAPLGKYREQWGFDDEGERAIFRYSFALNPSDIPPEHVAFFNQQAHYFIDEEANICYVHGGFYRFKGIAETCRNHPQECYWNRTLWEAAMSCGDREKLLTIDNFSAIFIGHTATTNWSSKEEHTDGGIVIPKGGPVTIPMFAGGVWNVDTGAGGKGKLTIMDADTKEFWQSDFVHTLYPYSLGT